jgi:hypothetical protein
MMVTTENCLYPRLRRQLRAQHNFREQFWTAQLAQRAEGRMPEAILMYFTYIAVLRAVLPCTYTEIRILRGTHD